jgi:hypothetical protein
MILKKVTVGIFAKLKKITIAHSLFITTTIVLRQFEKKLPLHKSFYCYYNFTMSAFYHTSTSLFIATTILLCQCTTILCEVLFAKRTV